ncbi:MAG TPA: hypothetical protein VKY85_16085 [Candidatus Angelobacter sp.]|nr:hypothetical protein [Candidatus Angelobacter sp.]
MSQSKPTPPTHPPHPHPAHPVGVASETLGPHRLTAEVMARTKEHRAAEPPPPPDAEMPRAKATPHPRIVAHEDKPEKPKERK